MTPQSPSQPSPDEGCTICGSRWHHRSQCSWWEAASNAVEHPNLHPQWFVGAPLTQEERAACAAIADNYADLKRSRRLTMIYRVALWMTIALELCLVARCMGGGL